MDHFELFPYGPMHDPFYGGSHSIYNRTETDFEATKQYRLFLSAGITACITSSFYNPLDCLRVRWQALPLSSNLSSKGIINFTFHILKSEGLMNGLWRPGIILNAMGMGGSAALRFGFYEHVRDSLQKSVNQSDIEEKKGVYMFLSGFSCGGIAYFITSPFHLMKTRLQVEKNGMMNEFMGTHISRMNPKQGVVYRFLDIIREHGFRGLWNGTIPVSARGACFTAGQMLGYDFTKTICKTNGFIDDGTSLHVVSSIVAAFGATMLSTPADFVMSRYVSRSSGSLSNCVRAIYEESGIIGFWRGSGICFLRVCPVMLSYSTIYEQLRYHFGLGYLT